MIDNQIDTQDIQDSILDIGMSTQSNYIKVLGVGGGGGNAVNHMFKFGIKDVDFIVANTDHQALDHSPVPVKIQLGVTLTEGLGAGNNPERGRDAALESHDMICEALDLPSDGVLNGPLVTKMLFVTAGMGGGTGTGAAPVIAKIAKDAGILTVAIVTLPFRFEGPKRVTQAIEGLMELSKNVDSLLVVDNEKVLQQFGELSVDDAFGMADDVLTKAAKGIAEIITNNGHVNVDFADVNTVLKDSGIALMGTGVGEGDDRATQAIAAALNSPLLSNNNIKGAKNVLINILSSEENALKMNELSTINKYVQRSAGHRANLIWGKSSDNTLGGRLSVTIVVAGFQSSRINNPFEDGGDDADFDFDNDAQIIITSNDVPESAPAEKKEAAPVAEEPKAQEQTSPEPLEAPNTTAEPEDHQAGDQVDLGTIEYDGDDMEEEEDDERVIEPTRTFQPIDYSSIEDMESYDRVPAYQRKRIELSINNYSANCKREPLNEA